MKKFFFDRRIVFMYLITIIFLIVGTTYALQSNSMSFGLTTALIGIDETAYGSTTFDAGDLELQPILDTEVETKTDNVVKIDFTVGGAETNNNDNIIYDIALVDLEANCDLLSPYLKWKLVKDGEEISSGSLDYKFDTIVDGRLILTEIQEDLPDYSSSETGYHDYSFYLWVSDSCQDDILTCVTNGQVVDQSSLLNKSLSGKIEVELYTEGKKELERNPESTLKTSYCVNKVLVEYDTSGGSTHDAELIFDNENGVKTYPDLPTPTRSYTVTYDTGGGTEVAAQTIDYTFNGWYSDKNYTTVVNSGDEMSMTKNHTLYAKWTGDNVITLPTVTKEGCDFQGWYSDSNYKTKIGDAGDSYQVFKDVTLYAKWKVSHYAVTYNSGNLFYGIEETPTISDIGLEYSIDSNGTVTATSFVEDGYTFTTGRVYLTAGTTYTFSCTTNGTWGGSGDTVEGFLMLDGLYNTYYWLSNGGTITPTVSGEYWLRFDVNTAGKTYTFSDIKISYTVATQYHVYGEEYGSLPTSPTRTGYEFNGWYTSETGGTQITSSSIVSIEGTHTLYAQWTANNYNVSFNANKFSLLSGTTVGVTITYDQDTSILTLDGTPTASFWLMQFKQDFAVGEVYKTTLTYVSGSFTSTDYYAFGTEVKKMGGKDLSSRTKYDTSLPTAGSTSGTMTITETSASEGEILQNWFWVNSSGAITFDNYQVKVNVIKVEDDKTVSYGSQYGTLPTDPTRKGHEFSGWYTAESGGNKITSTSTVATAADHTLYAHWTTGTYTLVADPRSGTIPSTTGWTAVSSRNTATKSITYNSAYGTLPTPTRTGYTFNGWYNGVTADISLVASSTNNYNYSYVLNDVYPGVTYTINMTSAALTAGTATSFTTVLYDFTANTVLASATMSFGSSLSYSLTCPETATTSNDIRLIIYAGLRGSTVGNAVTYSGVKVTTDGSATVSQVTASTVVSNDRPQVIFADWTINNYYIDLNWTLDGSNWSPAAANACAYVEIGGVSQGCVADYYTQHPHGTSYQITKIKLNGTEISYSYSGTVNGANLGHAVVLNTLTISRNNTSYGTTSASTLYVKNGTTYSSSTGSSTLTLGDGRTVTASVTAATGYTTTFGSWSSSSGTITSAATITANFSRNRNFKCASQGGTTTYAGKDWYTIDNDGSSCVLGGNFLTTNYGTYNDRAANVKTYMNGLISEEVSANLITAYDNWNGQTSVSGVHWYGDGKIRATGIYEYSCAQTWLYRGANYLGNTNLKYGCFTKPSQTDVSGIFDSYFTNQTTLDLGLYSDPDTDDIYGGTYSSSTISDYYSHYVTEMEVTAVSKTTVDVVRKVRNGSYDVIKNNLDGTRYRHDIYICGNQYSSDGTLNYKHGALVYRIWVNNSSTYNFRNVVHNPSGDPDTFSPKEQTFQMASRCSPVDSTISSTGNGLRTYKYDASDYCVTGITEYDIGSKSYPVYYMPKITVNIAT